MNVNQYIQILHILISCFIEESTLINKVLVIITQMKEDFYPSDMTNFLLLLAVYHQHKPKFNKTHFLGIFY